MPPTHSDYNLVWMFIKSPVKVHNEQNPCHATLQHNGSNFQIWVKELNHTLRYVFRPNNEGKFTDLEAKFKTIANKAIKQYLRHFISYSSICI
ncbi:uncharacterized protein VP01_521g8 [Puccinia sorghi]|uniref:Uncharacterized protein n=1 Tax=Puccinia sorghi TaxID=27349 RepID=A0A0L6UKL3_9BASI|nr:uncharacterized protein VP01_521g8 [Puccinia sorghi]